MTLRKECVKTLYITVVGILKRNISFYQLLRHHILNPITHRKFSKNIYIFAKIDIYSDSI
jgi:hypothetical protein